MNVLKGCITSFWAAWFCLIFTLIKNKGSQSAALLKMSPSPPSLGRFGVDIPKYKRLK